MITLTRLNGSHVCINVFLVEHLEETPDTVVTLTTGRRFVVRESAQEVIEAALRYFARLRQEGVNPLVAGQLGRSA